MRRPALFVLLFVTHMAQSQSVEDEPFDFEKTISIFHIVGNLGAVTVRPLDEYIPQNFMNIIFEAIYPHVYQLEMTKDYAKLDFDNMLIDDKLVLITPEQRKVYYFGSRWFATDDKIIPLTHEDYIKIQEALAVDGPRLTQPRDNVTIDRAAEKWTQQIHNRIYRENEVLPYSVYAGWASTTSAPQVSNSTTTKAKEKSPSHRLSLDSSVLSTINSDDNIETSEKTKANFESTNPTQSSLTENRPGSSFNNNNEAVDQGSTIPVVNNHDGNGLYADDEELIDVNTVKMTALALIMLSGVILIGAVAYTKRRKG